MAMASGSSPYATGAGRHEVRITLNLPLRKDIVRVEPARGVGATKQQRVFSPQCKDLKPQISAWRSLPCGIASCQQQTLIDWWYLI